MASRLHSLASWIFNTVLVALPVVFSAGSYALDSQCASCTQCFYHEHDMLEQLFIEGREELLEEAGFHEC